MHIAVVKKLVESSSNEIIQDMEESPEDTDKFYIQVGAFGLQENAQQMQEMLKTQKIDSKIITREVRSKALYCVWIIPGLFLPQGLCCSQSVKAGSLFL